MKRIITFGAAALMTMTLLAFDWSGKSGTVELPGEDVFVREGDLAVVTNLTEIVLSEATTRLIFDTTSDILLNGMIHGSGKIVKRGANRLCLRAVNGSYTVAGYYADHYVDGGIDLEGGSIVCPQGSSNARSYPVLTMNPGTVFYAQNAGRTLVRALNGYGVVTNTATSAQVLMIGINSDSTRSEYYGKICGHGISVEVLGRADILGTENTFGALKVYRNSKWSGGPVYGTMGVAKFGTSGSASSVGDFTSDKSVDVRFSGYLLYLGAGETTNRRFSFNYNPDSGNCDYNMTFDAGATGGLNLTGSIELSNADGKSSAITLTGSNTVPCTVSSSWKDQGTGTAHIVKEGSGTWRFADNASRNNRNAFTVKEGKIQFDSIAEAGTVCSLGLATLLQSEYQGTYSHDYDVPWAYLLGGTTTNVAFEYTGSAKCSVKTRTIALTGLGARFNNCATAGGMLDFSGVSAVTSGAKTLWLGGTNTMGRLSEVSNGSGVVGVIKEGPGTWTLVGNQTFSGPLEVQAGTLVVTTNRHYTWFRFTITEASAQGFFCGKIDLFDAVGNRLCRGIVGKYPPELGETKARSTHPYPYEQLLPGEATVGSSRDIYYWGTSSQGSLTGLFTNSNSDYYRATVYNPNAVDSTASGCLPIVFRLPNGSAEAVSFDLVQNNASQNVKAFTLEGSLNGIDWKPLLSKSGIGGSSDVPAGKWVSTGDTFVGAATHQPAEEWHFVGHEMGADVSSLANVSGVKVAADAALVAESPIELSRLTVDCAATEMGEMRGFSFAKNGVILVDNCASGTGEVSLAAHFVGCSGLENLKHWTVEVVGRPSARRFVDVSETEIKVTPPGTIMIVR